MNEVYEKITGHCNSCKFYDTASFGPVNYGQCRFYPPSSIEKIGDNLPRGIWPVVGYDDYCGKHEEN